MNELSIGEAARRANVRTSALRYYEEEGIIPAARRVNGRRYYTEDLLRLIEVARFAQSVGFNLEEIKALFADRKDPAAQWPVFARAKMDELDQVIGRAQAMKDALARGLRCGCIRLEDCEKR
jgi:MerR family redox-sensitive transcriptional activator SoxR